jgi:hypothetical protein
MTLQPSLSTTTINDQNDAAEAIPGLYPKLVRSSSNDLQSVTQHRLISQVVQLNRL